MRGYGIERKVPFRRADLIKLAQDLLTPTEGTILIGVLAFLAFEIAENWARIFLARAGIQSYSLFLLEELDGSTIGGAATVLAVSILVSLIMVLVYGIITDLLLDRRLNLE